MTAGIVSSTGNAIHGNVLTAGLISATSTITSAANITGANILTGGLVSATGNVTGNYIIGNGSQLTSITGGNVTGNVNSAVTAGTVTTNAQPNITSVGTLTSVTSSGLISTTGNVQGANVFATANISATGNVTGNYIIGNGSTLSSITGGNVTGQVANALIAGTVYTNAQPNITSVGTLTSVTSSGLISTTGNVQGANVFATANISATGNVTSGNILTGGQISSTGNITVSPTGFFVGNIIGNITGNLAVPGANTQVLYNNQGNVGASAGFTFNTATNAMVVTGNTTSGNILTAGLISATGNVTGNYILGNGSQLSSITGGNVTGQVGNALISGTVYTNAQPNITSVGTLTSLSVTGNTTSGNLLTSGLISATSTITSAANITGGNVLTAGLISSTGNATAGNILTSGLISATSTITSVANIIGGNVITAGQVSASGNLNGGNLSVTGNAVIVGSLNVQGNVTFIGSNVITTNDLYIELANNQTTYANINNAGLAVGPVGTPLTYWQYQTASNAWTTNVAISATANVIGGNILTGGQISSTGNITVSPTGFFVGNLIGNITGNLAVPGANTDILYNNQGNVGASAGFTFNAATNAMVVTGNTTSGNILTAGLISATGNVTGNYILGNGSTLTSITGGNVTGQVANALIAGTVYTNAQPNITSVGTLTSITSSGLISTTGNVQGANVFATANISATANVIGGNLLTTGVVSATGNTVAGNLLTSGVVSATANISGGNILTGGQISSTGNITVSPTGFFVGNIIGNVTGNLAVPGANTQILYNNQGNVGASAGFTFNAATNAMVVTGNTTSANILTGGLVSATGNVTGNYIIGNGSQLTSLTGGNVTGQVGNALISGTVYTNAQPNITSVGTLTSLSVTGNTTSGNLLTAGLISATSTITSAANITGGNVLTSGLISATANVTAGNILTAGIMSSTGNAIHGNILTGGQISSTGNITVGATGFFVGNIIGNVTGNLAVPGANTQVLYNNQGNVGASAGFTFNAATNAMVVTGNVTGGNILTTGLVSATGNVTGNYIIGNGSQLTSITGGNVTGQVGNALISGTVYTNAQPNITSVGTLTSVTSSGLISTTGNVQGANVFATANISAAGNVTGGNLLTSGGGGSISGAGSITAGGNITGGNILTGGQISSTGNITVSSTGFFVGNIIGNVTGNLAVPGANTQVLYNNQGNVGASAGFTFNAATNVMTVSGNTTSGNFLTGGLISATSTITSAANIIGANILTAGLISATSTITSAANIIGGNIITAGQVSASGNLNGGALSVSGNATIVGSLNVQGNVTFIGSNVITTNDLYIQLANNQSTYANINNAGLAVGPAGTPLTYWQYQNASNAWTTNVSISATANVIGGNILTGGQISSTGNITTSPTGFFVGNIIGNVTGNLAVPGANTYVLYNNQGNVGASAGFTFNAATNALGVTGTVSGSNFLTGGLVSASGNVTGSYFVGSGNGLSNIQGASVTGTVSSATTATTATTAGTVTTNAQPNITSVGTLSTLSVTGNTTTGNLLSNGQISIQGNITTASYFIGTFLGSISGNVTAPGTNTQVIYNNSGNLAGSTGFTYNSATNAISGGGNIIANSNVIVGGNITSAVTLTGYGLYAGNAGGTPVATFVYNNSAQAWTSNVAVAPAANISLNLGQTGYWWNNFYAVNVNTSAIAASGNITGGNILTGGIMSSTGNATHGNLSTGIVSATSVVGGVITGSSVSVSGAVTAASIGTSGASTAGSYSTAGGVTAASVAGGVITGTSASVSGTVTGASHVGSVVSVTGAVTAASVVGGVITGSSTSVTGTTTAASVVGGVITGTSLSTTGNITGGNVSAGGIQSSLGVGDGTNALRVTNPGGASYASNSGAVTGTFKIRLPQAWTNTMMRMTIRFYTYDGQSFDIYCGGYNYTGTSSWYNTFAYMDTNSRAALNVRFGYDGTYSCIYVGETSTVWQYPQVFVTDFEAGYSNFSFGQWNTGWAVTLETTQLSVTSTVNTAGVLTVNGASAATAIVNGGTTGVGNIGASGATFNTVFAKATTAQYADLAEMYVSDRDYPPGTVVEFGGDKEITAATNTHSTQIAGVVSTDPAYLMNSIQIGEYVLPVALTGRVPCQVIGKINKGDRLVSSNIEGVAQALDVTLYQPGVIIGKAIEPYDSDFIGNIEVAVGRF